MHGATPLCDAIAAIRDKRVSVVDLADNALNAIAERNADLRAFVFVDAPDVRAQARAIDARIRSGEPTGPLAGALIAVKDVIDVKGWPTLANSRTRARVPASRDAACITSLRQADAVLLGKTVTPDDVVRVAHRHLGFEHPIVAVAR